MRRLVPVLVLAAALLAPATGAAAVPKGWLGVSFGEYVAARPTRALEAELGRMKRSGVQSARFPLYWSRVQPYGQMSAVPARRRRHFRDVGGVPTDFRVMDRLVTAAAKKRLPLLPVLLGAPAWATADTSRPIDVPRDPADLAAFAAALAGRYGPGGAFFEEHPGVHRSPIRSWQVWNEVSNDWYWDSSWPTAYPRLLRAAYDAIKAVDPRARVIQAGINSGAAGPSWTVQDTLYRQLDAQDLGRPFDAVAVHVYTRTVSDAVKVVKETRKVMRQHGDTRPIRVSELSWPAAKGRLRDKHGRPREFFAATTDRGMATRLVRGVLALARQRRALGIAGVDWFQWASSYRGRKDAFRYSGLRVATHRRFKDKPAMTAYRHVARRLRRGL